MKSKTCNSTIKENIIFKEKECQKGFHLKKFRRKKRDSFLFCSIVVFVSNLLTFTFYCVSFELNFIIGEYFHFVKLFFVVADAWLKVLHFVYIKCTEFHLRGEFELC